MTRLENSKLQNSTRRPGWRPHRGSFGLELEIWSFPGAWCLGLGALVRPVFHRSQRGTHLHCSNLPRSPRAQRARPFLTRGSAFRPVGRGGRSIFLAHVRRARHEAFGV